MAQPVEFPGSNTQLLKPPGVDNVSDMPVHRARWGWASCWELSPDELAEVMRTGKVYLAIFTGGPPPTPVYLGSAQTMREVTVDYGGAVPDREAL